MNLRKFSWVWLFVLLLAGCRSYGPRFDARQPEPAAVPARYTPAVHLDEQAFSSIHTTNEIRPEWLQPPTDFFRLGPGDALEIEVLGEANSRAGAVVGPDGKIYYSLLPGLFVWGLTLTETKQLLENAMAKYLRLKPEMAVTLRTVGSKRVWILGSVQTPGVYLLTTPMTLLEGLSAAGGALAVPGSLSGMPNLDNSFLMRQGQIVRVDFHRLLSTGDLSQNLYLQPDDFIYLRSSTVRNVYVLGAVASPTVLPYSDQLSLLGAIASAGGTVEYAQVSQVAIVRGSLARPRIAVVNFREIYKGKAPDIRLEPGDLVHVPFVPYEKVAKFAEGVLRQFVYTVAANEGYNASGMGTTTGVIGVAPTPAPTVAPATVP